SSRAVAAAISLAVSSKLAGVQRSNFSLRRRTAARPFFSRSRSICETTLAVSGSFSKRRCPPSLIVRVLGTSFSIRAPPVEHGAVLGQPLADIVPVPGPDGRIVQLRLGVG